LSDHSDRRFSPNSCPRRASGQLRSRAWRFQNAVGNPASCRDQGPCLLPPSPSFRAFNKLSSFSISPSRSVSCEQVSRLQIPSSSLSRPFPSPPIVSIVRSDIPHRRPVTPKTYAAATERHDGADKSRGRCGALGEYVIRGAFAIKYPCDGLDCKQFSCICARFSCRL
jgi:hypothetical protein